MITTEEKQDTPKPSNKTMKIEAVLKLKSNNLLIFTVKAPNQIELKQLTHAVNELPCGS